MTGMILSSPLQLGQSSRPIAPARSSTRAQLVRPTVGRSRRLARSGFRCISVPART
jgi:hypothetical protein